MGPGANVWDMVKIFPDDELNKLSEYVKMEQSRRKGMTKVREIDAKSEAEVNTQVNRGMGGGASANPYAALQSQDVMNMNRQFGM